MAKRNSGNRPRPGRDSGSPGGGKGRREEASGNIWPMSGPWPDSGEARTIGQNELGQGTRGAAGYQDAGGPELTLLPPTPNDADATAPATTAGGALQHRHRYPSFEPHEQQAMQEAEEQRRAQAHDRPSA
jgi:hypothetical protein